MHDVGMELDWKALGAAIRQARLDRGLTMAGLADMAGVARASIHNLESGREANRIPTSLYKVAEVLGWPPDQPMAVLHGRELPGAPARSAPKLAEGMPLRISQELQEGQVLDTDVIDLSDGETRMIVVVKGKSNASPEEIRESLLAWQKTHQRLRRLTDDPNDEATAQD